MISGIVEHYDCMLSPVQILTIQMSAKLYEEILEGEVVSLAIVHREYQLTSAAYSSNHIDSIESTSTCHLIQLLYPNPTSLAMICVFDDTLINVDHSLSCMKSLNELDCCILPLKLCWSIVLNGLDWLNQPISSCKLTTHELPKEGTTHLQFTFLDKG